jgi:short-subunit dehydrogenase
MKKAVIQRARWALVTGASSGIGEAFARALATKGMNLVLAARREEQLRALAEQLSGEHGVQAEVAAIDLGGPGSAERLWAEAAQDRPIHLLVNNAGFGLRGRFEALTGSRLAEMVQLNCVTLMELAHLALPGMRERGEGGIINVGSIVSFQPVPLMAAYAASKAFVLSLSEALREENRGSGVRVLALCPGPVPSGFQDVAGTTIGERTLGVVSAAEVVRLALRGLDRDAGVIVPGIANRAGAVAAQLLPRGLAARIAGQVVRKMR